MSRNRLVWPSILLIATTARIPIFVTAFPSDALLRPFTRVFAQLATQVRRREGETYGLMTHFKLETLSGFLRDILAHGVFPITKVPPPGTFYGLSGWAF
jgi:hypothetical protein